MCKDAKENAVKEFARRNFLIVYGHNEQIKRAFEAGWDEALNYFANLPFDKMIREFENYLKSKEVKNG